MLKKILCLVLAALMAASCLAGCGTGGGSSSNGDDGEVVTLKWATSCSQQRDTAIVVEAVNKKLETLLPGIQLELIQLDSDKWDNWMAVGQEIDIAWTGYTFDMESQIRMGSYLALDELIEEYAPNIQAEMELYGMDYDTARYTDGKLYAIPNQQPFIAETPYLIVPAETMQYFDVDAFQAEIAKSPYTTRAVYEIIDDYLEAVIAADATNTDYVGKYINVDYIRSLVAMRGYYNAWNDQYYYKIWNDDGSVVTEPELVHLYETEGYQLWAEYISKWVKDGYASPTTADYGTTGDQLPLLSGHLNGMWNDFSNEGDDEERGIKAVYDTYGNITSYQVNIEPRSNCYGYYAGATLGAEKTYLCIPYTSQHPEEAIQLLDLMRDEKGTPGNDILNMLIYGFAEGSEEHETYGVYHYTLTGDQIHSDEYIQQAGENTSYGHPHWTMGNVNLCYRTELIAEGQQEYAIEYDTVTRLTLAQLPTAGFVFDTTELAAKVATLDTVRSDYAGRIDWGIEKDKTQALMEEALTKLRASGIESIKDEWYKQYNAWKAEQ